LVQATTSLSTPKLIVVVVGEELGPPGRFAIVRPNQWSDRPNVVGSCGDDSRALIDDSRALI
jgi:hypothetical protein